MQDQETDKVFKALVHLERRLDNASRLSDVEKTVADILPDLRKRSPTEVEQRVKHYFTVLDARYAAGALAETELTYLAGVFAGLVNDQRVMDGWYDDEFGPIREAANQVKLRHGFSIEAAWRLGEGPEEYQELMRQWDEVFDRTHKEVTMSLSTDRIRQALLDYHEDGSDIGAQSLLVWDDQRRLLAQLQHYEQEAVRCEQAGAYSAACTMIAAAIEARLLLACLRHKSQSDEARKALTGKSIGRDPLRWGLDDLIKVCEACGWLPEVAGERYTFSATAIARVLKNVRNGVHPGRQIREKAGLVMGQEQFKDILAANEILKSALP